MYRFASCGSLLFCGFTLAALPEQELRSALDWLAHRCGSQEVAEPQVARLGVDFWRRRDAADLSELGLVRFYAAELPPKNACELLGKGSFGEVRSLPEDWQPLQRLPPSSMGYVVKLQQLPRGETTAEVRGEERTVQGGLQDHRREGGEGLAQDDVRGGGQPVQTGDAIRSSLTLLWSSLRALIKSAILLMSVAASMGSPKSKSSPPSLLYRHLECKHLFTT